MGCLKEVWDSTSLLLLKSLQTPNQLVESCLRALGIGSFLTVLLTAELLLTDPLPLTAPFPLRFTSSLWSMLLGLRSSGSFLSPLPLPLLLSLAPSAAECGP